MYVNYCSIKLCVCEWGGILVYAEGMKKARRKGSPGVLQGLLLDAWCQSSLTWKPGRRPVRSRWAAAYRHTHTQSSCHSAK